MATIKGKVAKILNARELVLNIGSDVGVVTGMVFSILDQSGEDIRDPESGRVLGSLHRVKVKVKVNAVQKNMSVAITFRTTGSAQRLTNPFGTDLSSISQILGAYSRNIVRHETLAKPEGTYEPLAEKDSYVKVGDVAELVTSTMESTLASGEEGTASHGSDG